MENPKEPVPAPGTFPKPSSDTIVLRPGDEEAKGPQVSRITRSTSEKYSERKQLGRGGMKTVYRVIDRDTMREVALAVVSRPDEGETAEEIKARFVQEARITANLEHPHIIPVHDIALSDSGGDPFFTMKLVKGRSLQHIITSLAANEPEFVSAYRLSELLQIFVKVCDGVAFAHSKGIIHLDLKPDNIQVGDYGEVLVLDWGLAKFAPNSSTGSCPSPSPSIRDAVGGDLLDVTLDGNVKGTPGYMAPEQAAGLNSFKDQKADIYALGAILYTILTLKIPVEGASSAEVLDKTLRGLVTPPSFRVKDRLIPNSLDKVVMKAMSLRPCDRYSSVVELSSEIDAFIAGRATLAEDAGLLKQLYLLLKRNKKEAAILILCTMAIAILLSIFMLKLEVEKSRAVAAEKNANIARDKAQFNWERAEAERKTADAEWKRAEAECYTSNIKLAQRLLDSGEVGNAKEFLYACPLPLRKWEWRHLDARRQLAEANSFQGVREGMPSVSADGSLVCSAGFGPRIPFFDATTLQRKFDVHLDGASRYRRAAIAPDGSAVAVACGMDANKIALLSLPDGRILWTSQAKSKWRPVPFFADAGRLVGVYPDSSEEPIRLFDVCAGTPAGEFARGEYLTAAAVSGDGSRIIWASSLFRPEYSWRLTAADVATRKPAWKFSMPSKSAVRLISMSKDGGTAVVMGDDQTLRVFRVGSDSPPSVNCLDEPVSAMALTPDGTVILTGHPSGLVSAWESDGCKFRGSVAAGSSCGIEVSPDSQTAYINLISGRVAALKVADILASGSNPIRINMQHRVDMLEASPDNRFILAVSGNSVVIVDVLKSLTRKTFDLGATVSKAWWGKGGRVFAFMKNDLKGVRLKRLDPNSGSVEGIDGFKGAYALDCAPGTDFILAAKSDKLGVFDAATSQFGPFKDIGAGWIDAADVRGGRIAVTGEKRAAVLEFPSMVEIPCGLETSGLRPKKIRLSDDASMLAMLCDDSTVVWDIKNGRKLFACDSHPGCTEDAVFSPDGLLLATSGQDGKVKLWDAGSGREIMEFGEHTGWTRGVAFAGDTLASSSFDGFVILRGATPSIWGKPAKSD